MADASNKVDAKTVTKTETKAAKSMDEAAVMAAAKAATKTAVTAAKKWATKTANRGDGSSAVT